MGVYTWRESGAKGWSAVWVYDDDPVGTDSAGNPLHEVIALRLRTTLRDVLFTTFLKQAEKEWEREDSVTVSQGEREFNIPPPNRFTIALVPNPAAGEPGEPDRKPRFAPSEPTRADIRVT